MGGGGGWVGGGGGGGCGGGGGGGGGGGVGGVEIERDGRDGVGGGRQLTLAPHPGPLPRGEGEKIQIF